MLWNVHKRAKRWNERCFSFRPNSDENAGIRAAIDCAFGKELAKVVGDVEGEVDHIGNAGGAEYRADHPCLDNAQQPAEQGADHDQQAVSCCPATLCRIVQGSLS